MEWSGDWRDTTASTDCRAGSGVASAILKADGRGVRHCERNVSDYDRAE